ncbi:MAG TPA: excinuclease ABC subunit A, partial [Gemmata sp.]|nr:excinuclease ABC subunit A [Gemmata sp.]
EQKLPWEEDGRKWHTQDRVTTTGKPMKWDGAALGFVIDLVHKLGDFKDTSWKHRSVVEIVPAAKGSEWFLHAITGHEAYVKFVFRLPGRPFKEDQLIEKLGLKPLSDTPGLEGYSRDSNRVEVGNWPGAQYVVVIVHKKAEVDTREFREFLARAVEAVQGRAATSAGGIEGNMPWKKNGEKWHLGEKGFPPGEGAKWDRSLLPKLVKLLRDIDPSLELKWDVRDAITIRPAGSSRFWCRIKTKESKALEVWFTSKRGQVRLSQFENVGRSAALEGDRKDESEVLKLWLVRANHLETSELKPLLAEHLKEFKRVFGSGDEKEAG